VCNYYLASGVDQGTVAIDRAIEAAANPGHDNDARSFRLAEKVAEADVFARVAPEHKIPP
jgi:magnesium-transporting ATPase (P-type)